jgi:alkylation response protein AidB-like acyl-CoA dehydrogenase
MSTTRSASPAGSLFADSVPEVSFDNLFLADPLGEAFFGSWLGADYPAVREHFAALGRAGALAHPFSARADRETPRLETHDARGNRVDRIVYHPDYHALEDLAYPAGIVSRKYAPDFLARHRADRQLIGFGAAFYFAQTELGLFCPICMTDGVGWVLERHPPADAAGREAARETLSRLGHPERARRWRGAMFLTERQGGSDVGANAAVAEQRGGRWILSGDKWFCSNVDAEAILALARMPGAGAGTRGLGLFLVLRERPAGNGGTIRIHRLKDKLGVRSMPTGEVTLEGSEGYLIGGEGEGFKRMAEMINLSRLYNAVGSVAALRRGLLEALAHGARRRAFGSRLWELPLWRACMADLQAEYLGAFVLVFEAVRALDRSANGDETAAKLARLLTPLVKAQAGKLGVFGVSEAMEAVGGNGYIEESILPRLLRDAQVLPIWEGTTNILTLDVLRAVQKERAHEAFFDRLHRALAALPPEALGGRGLHRYIEGRLRGDAERLAALQGESEANQQRAAREWLESAGRTASMALLLEAAAAPALREPCLAALRRLQARPFNVQPLAGSAAVGLADTEEVLLRAGFAG